MRPAEIEVVSSTDDEAFEAMKWLTATEGILPALEPAHALAALPRLLRDLSIEDGAIVLLGLSGRGDKDLASYEGWLERRGVRAA